jgi:DNA-binding GntR family transcriptional regulator
VELLEQRATEADTARLREFVEEMRDAALNNDVEKFY